MSNVKLEVNARWYWCSWWKLFFIWGDMDIWFYFGRQWWIIWIFFIFILLGCFYIIKSILMYSSTHIRKSIVSHDIQNITELWLKSIRFTWLFFLLSYYLRFSDKLSALPPLAPPVVAISCFNFILKFEYFAGVYVLCTYLVSNSPEKVFFYLDFLCFYDDITFSFNFSIFFNFYEINIFLCLVCYSILSISYFPGLV